MSVVVTVVVIVDVSSWVTILKTLREHIRADSGQRRGQRWASVKRPVFSDDSDHQRDTQTDLVIIIGLERKQDLNGALRARGRHHHLFVCSSHWHTRPTWHPVWQVVIRRTRDDTSLLVSKANWPTNRHTTAQWSLVLLMLTYHTHTSHRR